MVRTLNLQYAVITMIFCFGVGCGQSALFRGNNDKLSLAGKKEPAGKSAPIITEVSGSEESIKSADAAASSEKDAAATAPVTPPADAATAPKSFEVPGAKPEEMAALNKCLSGFSNNPFPQKINNFRRINVSVVIGSTATPINDQKSTDEPELILVDVAGNYNSNVTYNMLNRNGYYCMTLNVNVKSNLFINLHCHAQVADSAIAVQVNSSTNGTPSTVGVNVNSLVKVEDVRPTGEACIR